MNQNPLALLFAGEPVPVTYLNGKSATVFVRALPQRNLHHVIATYEHKHLFVELCTYVPAGKGKPPMPASPDLLPYPNGYWPVQTGWSDNLDDASIEALYSKADFLNFERALAWAKGQISAKKKIAPLIEMTTASVLPLVQQMIAPVLERLDRLSSSTPSAPSSSD
jgi:hypothetical protein